MRDADELTTLSGVSYLASVPEGEVINAMVIHDGKLFVSTDKHVYTLEDGKRLERVSMEFDN